MIQWASSRRYDGVAAISGYGIPEAGALEADRHNTFGTVGLFTVSTILARKFDDNHKPVAARARRVANGPTDRFGLDYARNARDIRDQRFPRVRGDPRPQNGLSPVGHSVTPEHDRGDSWPVEMEPHGALLNRLG